ncbi:hypothetical protein PR202_gb01544 [Eleusine coracana subsp. coracana]|uniref:Uncharacterized protein n=1 Tax=Eleusine coracana subsp. coracana TaxID=191504 RepID=A0AAV5DWW2_ELECO|nr:hypothetical protein PR202_gb01544 [Eleusine coracana subsp. coracana]
MTNKNSELGKIITYRRYERNAGPSPPCGVGAVLAEHLLTPRRTTWSLERRRPTTSCLPSGGYRRFRRRPSRGEAAGAAAATGGS